MSNLPVQWMAHQLQLGHSVCLILDSDAAPAMHQDLLRQRTAAQYRSVYSETAVADLATAGPFIFLIDDLDPSLLDDLIERPRRDWGWLASIQICAIEALVTHWRERLLIGERPQRALYRFHDNRVLTRALAHLPESAYPEYLGPVISACYWQGEHWATAENPTPAEYPVPDAPQWLSIPAPVSQERAVLLANIGQYLLAEHSQDLAQLGENQSPHTWLTEQLNLAQQWGWQTSEQLHFLIVERLREMHTPGIKSWDPLPEEQARAHFERLSSELQPKLNTWP
jgi:hypothetical protein